MAKLKPQFSFANHILKWKDCQVDPLGSAFAESLRGIQKIINPVETVECRRLFHILCFKKLNLKLVLNLSVPGNTSHRDEPDTFQSYEALSQAMTKNATLLYRVEQIEFKKKS